MRNLRWPRDRMPRTLKIVRNLSRTLSPKVALTMTPSIAISTHKRVLVEWWSVAHPLRLIKAVGPPDQYTKNILNVPQLVVAYWCLFLRRSLLFYFMPVRFSATTVRFVSLMKQCIPAHKGLTDTDTDRLSRRFSTSKWKMKTTTRYDVLLGYFTICAQGRIAFNVRISYGRRFAVGR